MNICRKTIQETVLLLRSRKIGAAELAREYLKEIEKKNQSVNANVTVCHEEAVNAAEKAQKLLDSGVDVPLLCGIPMGLKDNICTKDIKTTCASKMLENYIPPYSATVYERLEKAGAVLLGKLNMDEFAMGGSSEHTVFGPVRNPWNTEYVAGGSSGGSAACVAANMAAFSLGSDTGGSVRQPASFCGVVGLKPTYGRVSRYGLIAFASSLDQIGPLTKSIYDCVIVMNAISGYDSRDSTSVDIPCDNYLQDIDAGIENLKIGLPSEFFNTAMDDDVKDKVLSALKRLESRGAILKEVSLSYVLDSVPAYYLISSSEASSNLARYDGIRYGYRNEKAENISQLYRLSRGGGFGREVKRRILTGTYALSSGYHDELYIKALKVRRLIADDFNRAFDNFDLIAAPVYPATAFKIGERTGDPLKMYLGDIFTVSANLAGIPALSVPCGLYRNGLPIGIQLMGKPFSEKLLLRAGLTVEQETGRPRRWDDRKGESVAMRNKEETMDYRYFPEPDLLPVVIDKEWVASIEKTMPELPKSRRDRYVNDFGIPKYDADIITINKKLADIFDRAAIVCGKPKLASNFIMTDIMRRINENGEDILDSALTGDNFGQVLLLLDRGDITHAAAIKVIDTIIESGEPPEDIIERLGLWVQRDEDLINSTVRSVLTANRQALDDFLAGKEKAFGFLMGQVMSRLKGRCDPAQVREVLLKETKNVENVQ